MNVLSEAEVQRLLSLLMGHPDQRFAMTARLAVASGCRRGELCGLRWEDVDFNQSTLHIKHSLSEVEKKDAPNGETLHLKDTKTCENRNIVIDSETMRLLNNHKTQQCYQLSYNDCEQNEKTPVFAGVLGQWYRPSNLTKHFEVFAYKHEFDIRFHDIRHTHASILIMSGENIVTVSKRLGHAKVSTTLDIYSHLMPGQDVAVANKLSDLFTKDLPTDDSLVVPVFENTVPKVSQTTITRVPNEKIDSLLGSLFLFSAPFGTHIRVSFPIIVATILQRLFLRCIIVAT